MTALLDNAGQPCQVRFNFYPLDTTAATYAQLEPILSLDADPQRLFRQHIDELLFTLARTMPELAGSKVAITLTFDTTKQPPMPMLHARAMQADVGLGTTIGSMMVPLTSIDTSHFSGILNQQGHNPASLVFVVSAVPCEGKPRPRMLLQSASRTSKPELGVEATIPYYAIDEGTPLLNWQELDPIYCYNIDLPWYLPKTLLETLRMDEYAFGKSDTQWHERSWFLTGAIKRRNGELIAVVENLLAAAETTATAAELAFTPNTWARLHERLETSGQVLLGWLHTHSLQHLHENTTTNLALLNMAIPNSINASPEATPAPTEYAQGSGLFLSATDMIAARGSFAAPSVLIGVVDADSCHQGSNDPQHLLALWGWQHGLLVRRSARLINDINTEIL